MVNRAKLTILSCNNVSKHYIVGSQKVPVLNDISLSINTNDFIVIFGPSGCGKSTLLHILLGLEAPSSGKAYFDSKDIFTGTDEDARAVLRKKNVGMVYQQPNWIKSLSVIENVAFPLTLNGIEQTEARSIALKKLTELSMQDWAEYHPSELSSGQQQKVALARCVSTDPRLIIADEPTGNLDYESGLELMNLLTELNERGKTVIMVTHDLDYLAYAGTAIEMFDGKIVKEYKKNEIPNILSTTHLSKTKRRHVPSK